MTPVTRRSGSPRSPSVSISVEATGRDPARRARFFADTVTLAMRTSVPFIRSSLWPPRSMVAWAPVPTCSAAPSPAACSPVGLSVTMAAAEMCWAELFWAADSVPSPAEHWTTASIISRARSMVIHQPTLRRKRSATRLLRHHPCRRRPRMSCRVFRTECPLDIGLLVGRWTVRYLGSQPLGDAAAARAHLRRCPLREPRLASHLHLGLFAGGDANSGARPKPCKAA